MAEDDPKIIVDSDWKNEARQEKERLAEAAEHASAQPLPDPNFFEIVNLIAMQAIIGLGGMKTPDGQQVPQDLRLAEHNIGLLEILREKTSGNLNEAEQKAFDSALHELRLSYVHASSVPPAEGQDAPPPK